MPTSSVLTLLYPIMHVAMVTANTLDSPGSTIHTWGSTDNLVSMTPWAAVRPMTIAKTFTGIRSATGLSPIAIVKITTVTLMADTQVVMATVVIMAITRSLTAIRGTGRPAVMPLVRVWSSDLNSLWRARHMSSVRMIFHSHSVTLRREPESNWVRVKKVLWWTTHVIPVISLSASVDHPPSSQCLQYQLDGPFLRVIILRQSSNFLFIVLFYYEECHLWLRAPLS